jgi:hypothetical protein
MDYFGSWDFLKKWLCVERNWAAGSPMREIRHEIICGPAARRLVQQPEPQFQA